MRYKLCDKPLRHTLIQWWLSEILQDPENRLRGIGKQAGRTGKTSFINCEICFRLVHNEYVQVLLEKPRREGEELEADRLTAILEKMLQQVQVKLRDFHRELGL